MQQQPQQTGDRAEREMSFRQGYAQAFDETARLVLRLVELGYTMREIKQLLAVYDDHFLAVWRQSDPNTRNAAPPFDIVRCRAILAGTSGYDWIV